LRQVAGSADHRSACWLPVDEVGLSDDVDRKREQVAMARRGTLAAESSDVLDDSDVPDGSAADLSAEEVAGKPGSGRSKPLAKSSTHHEVRASTTTRAGRTAQPAPPARPRRSAAGNAEPAAAPKTPAKPRAKAPAAGEKSPTKATSAKRNSSEPAAKTAGSRRTTKNGGAR
jgi:hypothetical protein